MPLFFPVSQKQDQRCPEWALRRKERLCAMDFLFEGMENRNHLTLKKNSFYHDHRASSVREIYFPLIPDPQRLFLLFEKGEIDWVGDPFTKLP